jgi:antitoxin MazE
MARAVHTRLIRIGNSQGVRIPKALVEQAGLRDDVEIRLEDDRLIISAAQHPRSGWEEAFRTMAERHDDALPGPGMQAPTAWDLTEWQW